MLANTADTLASLSARDSRLMTSVLSMRSKPVLRGGRRARGTLCSAGRATAEAATTVAQSITQTTARHMLEAGKIMGLVRDLIKAAQNMYFFKIKISMRIPCNIK